MTQGTKTILQDKRSIMSLFAGFMTNPQLLGKTKEYGLTLDDLPEKLHKLLYGTMFNMYQQGITTLSSFEIDTFLSTKENQYRLFNDNNGRLILEKLEELGSPENFNYHYQRVKKYSFLRKCITQGIDVSDILDPSLVDIKETERQQSEFDQLTLDELIKRIEERFVDIREEFRMNEDNHGSHMSEGIEDMLENMYETPSYGASFSSGLLTRILRGAVKKKFHLRSAPTGVGKSRYALADLCTICIPEIWDLDTKKWVLTGNNEKGLFITTELTKPEIQLPALCYISGVPEWKVRDAKLSADEKKRMQRAVTILKNSNLYIEHLNDFDIADIEECIERNVVKNDVEYIVFDYIHTSMKLLTNMTKASKINMREDQILLLMSDKIKQICNKYDVWILSGTQLNNEWKAEGGVNLDASSLRGARSLGDKLDCGTIMTPITREDEKVLESIRQENPGAMMGIEPNTKVVVFKNRSGQYTSVVVWLNIDLGNLRTRDMFVTDMSGKLLPEVKPVKVVFKDADTPKEEDTLPEAFFAEPKPSEKMAF